MQSITGVTFTHLGCTLVGMCSAWEIVLALASLGGQGSERWEDFLQFVGRTAKNYLCDALPPKPPFFPLSPSDCTTPHPVNGKGQDRARLMTGGMCSVAQN